jgi:tetratricopeptide (TPR) repeat protein
LALVTVAVYLPVARNGFVNYDDSDYVTVNSHVQSGLRWENVVWAFKTGHASNWHPLTWLSHMLDCQVFGSKAGGPHLVSVAIHAVNAVLLFLLLRRMTGEDWRSAAVAALFALHPLHVESVVWVSERKDVLSTLFFFLALWAYVHYAQREKKFEIRNSKFGTVPKGRPRSQGINNVSLFTFDVSRWYVLSILFFALGLMSKPMLVTVPFVLLLLDYWPLGRCARKANSSAAGAGPSWWRRWGRLLAEKAPFFVLAAVSSMITFVVQRKGGAVSTTLSLGARVANALVSYVRYIRKTFWPDDLSVLYPHPGQWPAWEVIVCAILLVAISAAVFLVGRDRPYLAVGWLWFLGTLVPVIGLVQVGIQSMADRYTYVPLIGLFIMLVWGVAELILRWPNAERVFALGAVAVLLVLVGLTIRQVGFWRTSETLFRHAVNVTPNNYLAYNNLGYYLAGVGRTAEAMEDYRMSLKINPAYEDALNNLGYGYAGQKNYTEAIRLYESALRIRPQHPEVHNNLGNALAELGKVDEAIAHYLITLEQKPDHADAHNNLGIALAMKGKLDEAIPHFYEAIRCKPNNASAHGNLGNALAAQHKLEEAIKEYQEALRLKPDDAQSQNNLGNALAEQGKVVEAIGHYRQALRLNADNPEAEYNLGLALLRAGQRDEALTHLREALRLKPDYAEVKRQLEALATSATK